MVLPCTQDLHIDAIVCLFVLNRAKRYVAFEWLLAPLTAQPLGGCIMGVSFGSTCSLVQLQSLENICLTQNTVLGHRRHYQHTDPLMCPLQISSPCSRSCARCVS
jgi:hypothetical protein